MRPRRFREYSHSVLGLESIWCDSSIIDSGIHLRLIFPPSIIDRNGRGDRDVCPLSFGSETCGFWREPTCVSPSTVCLAWWKMPELPEVEIIVRDLRPEIIGRSIVGIQTDWPKYFIFPSSEARFRTCVMGKAITAVDRRGKNILISLMGDYLLLIHQKISGRLMVGNWERRPENEAGGTPHSLWQPISCPQGPLAPRGRFIHLLFDLDDGRQLGLSDLRKFAKALCSKREVILNRPEIRQLGPEPLDPQFTLAKFKQLFAGRKGRIKQMLMNPNFIAGIGNIYSDEILYAAGIHPLSPLANLQDRQLKALYGSIKKVLKKAVRMRGTGMEGGTAGAEQGYDKIRMVYQRKECPRGHQIQRIRIGGRSARFCPVEQTLF